jgi:hypothetical protein
MKHFLTTMVKSMTKKLLHRVLLVNVILSKPRSGLTNRSGYWMSGAEPEDMQSNCRKGDIQLPVLTFRKHNWQGRWKKQNGTTSKLIFENLTRENCLSAMNLMLPSCFVRGDFPCLKSPYL